MFEIWWPFKHNKADAQTSQIMSLICAVYTPGESMDVSVNMWLSESERERWEKVTGHRS